MRRFELLLAIYRYVLAILRKKKKTKKKNKKKKEKRNRGGSIRETKIELRR